MEYTSAVVAPNQSPHNCVQGCVHLAHQTLVASHKPIMVRAGTRRSPRNASVRYNTRHARRKLIINAYTKDKSQSLRTIAAKAGVDPKTVRRTIARFEEDGTLETKPPGPKQGSHPKGTAKAIHFAVLKMKGRRGVSARAAAAMAGVSDKTVRRAAHEAGMDFAVGPRTTRLTDKQRKDRLDFASRHAREYHGIPWRRALYVDATPLYMGMTKGRKGMAATWDKHGKHPPVQVEGHSAKVMAYGGITARGPTPLYFVTGTTGVKSAHKYKKGERRGTPYIGCCADEYKLVAKKLQADGRRLLGSVEPYLYVHDNASIHKSTNTMFKREGQPVVDDWPTKMMDCNPIENAWGILDRDVWKAGPYTNMANFKNAIKRSWARTMTADMCNKLCRGVPKRLKLVKEAKGAKIRH